MLLSNKWPPSTYLNRSAQSNTKMCSTLTASLEKNYGQRWRLQGNHRHSASRLTCCWQKWPALGIDCLIAEEMLWLFKYHMQFVFTNGAVLRTKKKKNRSRYGEKFACNALRHSACAASMRQTCALNVRVHIQEIEDLDFGHGRLTFRTIPFKKKGQHPPITYWLRIMSGCMCGFRNLCMQTHSLITLFCGASTCVEHASPWVLFAATTFLAFDKGTFLPGSSQWWCESILHLLHIWWVSCFTKSLGCAAEKTQKISPDIITPPTTARALRTSQDGSMLSLSVRKFGTLLEQKSRVNRAGRAFKPVSSHCQVWWFHVSRRRCLLF